MRISASSSRRRQSKFRKFVLLLLILVIPVLLPTVTTLPPAAALVIPGIAYFLKVAEGLQIQGQGVQFRFWGNFKALSWINVRDPLYFLGYGIPYIYVKRILFSS